MMIEALKKVKMTTTKMVKKIDNSQQQQQQQQHVCVSHIFSIVLKWV